MLKLLEGVEAMNYSWAAYENGLKRLSEYIALEYAKHEGADDLRVDLLENIAQARHHGDTPESCTARKRLVAELNHVVKQATGVSFIQICISTSPELGYLTSVYNVAQCACDTLSSERVWPGQCQDIVEQFGERPVLDSIAAKIPDTTQVSLRHIDNRISGLVQVLEDFEECCPPPYRRLTKNLRNKQAEIFQQLVFFVREVRMVDCSAFEEFIIVYQKVGEITNTEQSSISISSQPFSQEEHIRTSFSTDDATEVGIPSSEAHLNAAELEEQHQDIHQQLEQKEAEGLSAINFTTLREAIVDAFSEDDLRILCADIGQALRNNRFNRVRVSLDFLTGSGLPGKVQSLIDYCEMRGWLSYLVEEVHKARPDLEF
jgi:hypothetical protein